MWMALWIVVGLLGVVLVILAMLSALSPTVVRYTESIRVGASADEVYDHIRFQERLMRWSAWPEETGTTCEVGTEKAADGEVGAQTVFISKGKRIGYQEVIRLQEGREVELTLEGPGPPHEPGLVFRIEPEGQTECVVHLDFENRLPRPFNAAWKFAGLSNWTRSMHVKDLAGLKRYSEAER